jgi:hypothetical protein
MKREAILATTNLDRHFERFTKEVLVKMVEDVNNDSAAILYTIEHDTTIPPFGKTIKAELELREDGEYQVVATNEFFEEIEWLELSDGTKVFKQGSKEDRRPFRNRYSELKDDYSIGVDWNNFEPKSEYEKYLEDIRNDSNVEFSSGHFGRKSYIPDPEIIIGIVKLIGTYLIAKKGLDKIGDKIGDIAAEETEKFYKFIKSAVINSVKYLKPANRPKTYVFIIYHEPLIEFVAKTKDADKVVSALTIEKLEKTLDSVVELINKFKATRVQYILDEDGEWKFNYLLTNEGDVIGTKKSLSRRATRIKLLNSDGRTKQLIEKSVEKLISKLKTSAKRK